MQPSAMPATLSTTSTRPNVRTAAAIMASTSASLVTSQCTARALPPNSAAVSCSAPLMSAATTLAPSRTNTLTDAFAIPDPAPVITATLPSNRPIGHLRREHRERLVAPDRGRRCEPGAVPIDRPFGEALQHFLERHPTLEPGQRSAEAEVGAVTESEVLADVAMDVEPVTVRM